MVCYILSREVVSLTAVHAAGRCVGTGDMGRHWWCGLPYPYHGAGACAHVPTAQVRVGTVRALHCKAQLSSIRSVELQQQL